MGKMALSESSGRSFYAGLIEALLSVMGSSKGYLLDHGPRTAHLAHQLAEAYGCSGREIGQVSLAGVLCDVGMIGLAEDAWEVPVPVLDPTTRGLVRAHPIRSEATLAGIPYFASVARLSRSHHEWWNGQGYPDEIAGDEIPIGARILRLADTVTALGEGRPQRPARSRDEIRSVVRDSAGREFDPELARLWLDLDDADGLSDFSQAAYRRWSWEAADALLPQAVSSMSSENLLEILASIIDAKDSYTAGHSRRVATLAVWLAGQMGLGEEVRDTLWAAGFLHDLGKLSVPIRVLSKPGGLDDVERALIRGHTTRGAEVLGSIPTLRHLSSGARYHHERWDGSGYPEGLSGDRIPLVARVLAVADAYDAMTSGRAYRPRQSHQEAISEIRVQAGYHFCPEAAAALVSLPRAIFETIRADAARVPVAGMEWPRHMPHVHGSPTPRNAPD